MRIAFFDSGIGGLTVLKEAINSFNDIEYIYYADTKNVPYGVKSRVDVKNFIIEATDFIYKNNINALVIACNTATSVAIKEIREKYDIPIVGMEPAVKPAIKNGNNKNILVIATSLTLIETKLNELISSIDENNKIIKMEMDGLVGYAEAFNFNSVLVRKYIKEKLRSINLEEFETIVLGCTHFIFYKEIIEEIVGNKIKVIDGNIGTINQLGKITNLLRNKNDLKEYKNNIEFYSSGVLDDKRRINKLLEIMKIRRKNDI